MKFNIYLENRVFANENILNSDEFKKLWEEKEISALFSYYGCDFKIIPQTKKTDTN